MIGSPSALVGRYSEFGFGSVVASPLCSTKCLWSHHACPLATQQHTHKGENNRRILSGGLPVSDSNLTKDQNSSSKENSDATKLFPSMVVLVLVDPREGSDGDIYGTKSLSRVFILVLIGGEKYVTYSCVLLQAEVFHLVTTSGYT
ncbi:hypothetical protein YC2023_091125 [Brassica napus]